MVGPELFYLPGGLPGLVDAVVYAGYALQESLIWFRFPLFAMATVFWLARDRRLLYAMILSAGVGMMIMTGILTVEMIVEGQKGGRDD